MNSDSTELTTWMDVALQRDWLLGLDARQVFDLYDQRRQELQRLMGSRLAESRWPVLLLAEAEPDCFLAGFFAAVAVGCPVFLGNPRWGQAEWQQVWTEVRPDRVWGVQPEDFREDLEGDRPLTRPTVPIWDRSAPGPWMMIPTGGSSGRLRFAMHTWASLMAAVEGFRDYFEASPVNACCVLPLYHVSGLMQALRCLATGGTLAVYPFSQFEHAPDPAFDPTDFFLSLVPTQLQRLLRSPLHPLLARFRAVLLGGAPAWAELLTEARSLHIPLAPTYGMTETAAQVATLKPERFLQGHTSAGQVLPHARITIHDDEGHPLGIHQTGQLCIQARSLAWGYFPEDSFESAVFYPNDLGFFDEQGELHIVGRASDTIITGGEKVAPAEVEAAIRATGWVSDVAVIGLSDRHWGEQVVALYVPAETPAETPAGTPSASSAGVEQMERQLKQVLSSFKCPKQWIAVDLLPRNAQGKLNRLQLQQMALSNITQR